METLDREEPPGHSARQPELTWEAGSYKLSDIVKKFPLPVVAQYDWRKHPIPFNQFNFDLSQPLLLYKRRNIQKVPATSLAIQDGSYVTVGESLLIPEDYKGWFAVLQRPTEVGSCVNDTVPHFSTVEDLAVSNTDRFLIGGTSKIIGLQILERSESHLNHEQRAFLPGELLTKGKIYYGETKKKTRLFRKPKYITEKFLMCSDDSDHEVLIPFTQKGIFYQVSAISGKPNRNVMQMSDIVAKKLPPRILKLVYGQFPITPCSFTGLMRAEPAKLESSLIAATLVNRKNILLELPLDTFIFFRVAHTTDDVRQNQCFLNAMKLCSEKATTYMRNIKVSINFSNENEQNTLNGGKSTFSIHKDLVETKSDESTREVTGEEDLEKVKENDKDPPLGVTRKEDEKERDKYISFNGFLPQEACCNAGSVNTSFFRWDGKMPFGDNQQGVLRHPNVCKGSMSHVSICFGNGYQTLPIYSKEELEPETDDKDYILPTFQVRNQQEEEDNNDSGVPEDEIKDTGSQTDRLADTEAMERASPPPPSCVTTYVNVPSADAPSSTDQNKSQSPSHTARRRSSTKPPDVSPPPIPAPVVNRSSSSSSTSEGTASKRSSSEPSEYDVPRLDESKFLPSTPASVLPPGVHCQGLGRRPSTFTFTEGGGFGSPRFRTNDNKSNRTSISSTEESGEFDDGPVYANIEALKELEPHVGGLSNSRNTDANTDFDAGNSLPSSSPSSDDDEGDEAATDNNASKGQYEKLCEAIIPPPYPALSSNKSSPGDSESPLPVITEDSTGDGKIQEPPLSADHKNFGESENHLPVIDEDTSVTNIQDEQVIQCIPEDSIRLNALMTKSNVSTSGDKNTAADDDNDDDDGDNDYVNVRNTKRTNSTPDRNASHYSPEKEIRLLTVEELAQELTDIGLREETVEQLQSRGVDGKELASAESDTQTLKDFLPEVRHLDLQKLSMFIRGWRPQTRVRATDTV